ncbi:hypothetical protein [Idiomarina xiamenensis]|uniref:Peptidase S9, prolyl oligopeptidase active site region n=1 Tax=Idiomarina xiamenensis 10-D-4 TaxID=740709 RepID=K2K5B7_9GAMM|nr:hypothetical protein [Idiomarina xiamenensis]EKE82748.1 peptidase S9, prolyl oligopeptidase active site region [Idiomarina xiamenensis 10-D-4]
MSRQRFFTPVRRFWLASICLSGSLQLAQAAPVSAIDNDGLASQAATATSDTQRPLTVTDIMKFRAIEGLQLSDQGDWIAYEARPDRGDSEAIFRALQADTEWRVERGTAPQIASDRQWGLVKQLAPLLEREQAGKKDKPAATAVLVNLQSGEQQVFAAIQRAGFTGDATSAVFLSDTQSATNSDSQNTDKESDEKPAQPTLTSNLILLQLASQQQQHINDVSQFAVAEQGP